MENQTPSVTVRVALDSDRPYVAVSSTMPYGLEDEQYSDVVALIRRLRQEFSEDYAKATEQSWAERIGNLVPPEALLLILDENELLDDVPFPIAKKWQDGYESTGKPVSQVYEENKPLCDWLWERYTKTGTAGLPLSDKLAFAALSVLRNASGQDGDF